MNVTDNNSCHPPLDEKREGLGGMVTPIFNDLLNDHDGFRMMMKDKEGHERARGRAPGSRSGAGKGIWRRTPGGGGFNVVDVLCN